MGLERRARHERRRRERRRRSKLLCVLAGVVDALRGRKGWTDRDDPRFDNPAGGLGVREPRRPRPSPRSGAVALEPPLEEEQA